MENQEGISFNIPRAKFCMAEIMSQKILMTHGEQAKSWMGIPFYGLSRLESKYKNIIDGTKKVTEVLDLLDKSGIDQENTEAVVKFVYNYVRNFQYQIVGHFHAAASLETNGGGKIIVNSSFVGGDDYSINDLVSANEPSQKFFGMSHEGMTWSYDINLDRK